MPLNHKLAQISWYTIFRDASTLVFGAFIQFWSSINESDGVHDIALTSSLLIIMRLLSSVIA